jgi:hypothetical protein
MLSLSFVKLETILLSLRPPLLGLKPLHAHEDLPDIKFWTRNEWVASKEVAVSADQAGMRGRSRAAKGENVTMNFIEDTDGQAIDGHKASEIRKVLRELWMEMDQVGSAPRSWSKVAHTVLMNFRQRMYDRFPELAYCDGHWKLDKICTDNYSQWFHTHNSNDNSNQSTSKQAATATASASLSLDPESVPRTKKPKLASQLRSRSVMPHTSGLSRLRLVMPSTGKC